MAVPDKIEAVSKLSETVRKEGGQAEEMQRASPNKEHFDALMNQQSTVKQTSFERLDTKAFQVDETQNMEKNPIFTEENTSSQQSGSSSDQQNRQKKHNETEEIEGVSGVGAKKRSVTEGQTGSLMDEVTKLHTQVSGMSKQGPDAIKKQAQEAIAKLDEIKTNLSSSKTDIKPSYQTILKNRLSHIDDSIKIAMNKAGIEYTPPPASVTPSESANPLRKFINMVSDSQHQLEHLNSSIDAVSQAKGVTPAQMMAIQMKMNFVTQQLELFSNILNKALESTKTIMNVQV